MERTLGTQLRHLLDLLDGAVERNYANMGLAYRARYTPVMRCLIAKEPRSLGEVARCAGITQPGATQTVSLMIENDLIETAESVDARQKLLKLTAAGRAMAGELQKAWVATALAAESLDRELPVPLSEILAAAINALEAKSFDQRICNAEPQRPKRGNQDD